MRRAAGTAFSTFNAGAAGAMVAELTKGAAELVGLKDKTALAEDAADAERKGDSEEHR